MTNEKLADLQRRIETAQTKRARAQADYDLAVKQQQEALTELKEKFGVDDLPAAVALLKENESALRDLIEQTEKALEEAGA